MISSQLDSPKTLPWKHLGGILARCLNHLNLLLSMRRSSKSTLTLYQMTDDTLSLRESIHPTEETGFSRLYPQSYSFARPWNTSTSPLETYPAEKSCLKFIFKIKNRKKLLKLNFEIYELQQDSTPLQNIVITHLYQGLELQRGAMSSVIEINWNTSNSSTFSPSFPRCLVHNLLVPPGQLFSTPHDWSPEWNVTFCLP